jgi:gas vesicle protein
MNLNFSTREARKKNAQKLAVGSVIAAAAGYVAGVLTAPKSGKETRDDIKNAAAKGVNNAEAELKKLGKELDKSLDEAKVKGANASAKVKDELKELAKKAKDSSGKAGEVLSAVRKGEAKDEDLAKAVKQAKNALANLRKYLNK